MKKDYRWRSRQINKLITILSQLSLSGPEPVFSYNLYSLLNALIKWSLKKRLVYLSPSTFCVGSIARIANSSRLKQIDEHKTFYKTRWTMGLHHAVCCNTGPSQLYLDHKENILSWIKQPLSRITFSLHLIDYSL